MKIISKGSKIGIHAIWPNQTMNYVRWAKDNGFNIPVVKGVDNAGLAIDVKKVSPETITITRFLNKWDSAQDGDIQINDWTDETYLRGAKETIRLIFDRTNNEEFRAADYFEILNEADPPDVEGWKNFGRFIIEVIKEADKYGIKLALPAFNAGTPEWGEIIALVETGVFGYMKNGGHILTIHEGVFGANQEIDLGYWDDIPGVPQGLGKEIGAGSLCFRYRYLYHLLKQRKEVVNCVISEFYAGGGYDLDPAKVVERMAWYDTRVRQDYYVLGVLPFTVDASPNWKHSEYNYAYEAILNYMNTIKNENNALETNPVPAPPPVSNKKLVGLHGRADGPMQMADFEVVHRAKIEAVKLLTTSNPDDVDKLRINNPNIFILVRLFASFQNGRVVRPDDFTSWLIPEIRNFYARGIRYFEVHNEPNLIQEGLGANWTNGVTFADWFIRVYNLLKSVFPDVKLGFPGISPGMTIPGVRMNSDDFLNQARPAVDKSDWVGVHCYWGNEQEMTWKYGGHYYKEYQRLFPDKELFITEFSNNLVSVSKKVKGEQYVKYYNSLKGENNIISAFSYVVSASNGFAHETWRDENGNFSEIVEIVGNRNVETLVGRKVETRTGLNLRGGPGSTFPILTTFYVGTSFEVQEQNGNWIRVTTNGWVHKDYIRVV